MDTVPEKHVILLGAGAIGVLSAAGLLQKSNVRLTVAADAARVARYRRDNIYLNDYKLPFSYASPEEMKDLPPADLILVATKTYSLEEALENIVPLTDSETVFLPLLNGISARDVILKKFPENIVLYGYFLGHASVREANHVKHDGVGTFYIGGDDLYAREAASLLDKGSIKTELPEDIQWAMWRKFVLNVGVNQAQAVFKADYQTMQDSAEMMEYAENLMNEAVMIARLEGIGNTENMVKDALHVIRKMPGNVKTSMLQDVLSGRPTEVDAFAGTLCAKAVEYKIDLPYNREVLEKLKSR